MSFRSTRRAFLAGLGGVAAMSVGRRAEACLFRRRQHSSACPTPVPCGPSECIGPVQQATDMQVVGNPNEVRAVAPAAGGREAPRQYSRQHHAEYRKEEEAEGQGQRGVAC